ncbi:hypothetical protein niasHT_009163 [Heterodera trifolii]|uniref:Uncharacterized protein n=1 Tax=Heterodera trifolii TaxID=157864 RepID=A0ABD2ME40_9BILA
MPMPSLNKTHRSKSADRQEPSMHRKFWTWTHQKPNTASFGLDSKKEVSSRREVLGMPMPSLNKTHRSKSADRQEPSMHRKFWTWTHQKPNTASFGLDSKKEVSSRREVLGMPMPSLNKTHRSKSADRQEPSMHRKFWTWTHQKPNTASFGLNAKKEVSSRREVLGMPMPSLNKTHRSKSADRQEPSMHRKFWTWTHQKPNTASFGLDSKKEVSSRREVLGMPMPSLNKTHRSKSADRQEPSMHRKFWTWTHQKPNTASFGLDSKKEVSSRREVLGQQVFLNFENDQTKNPVKPGPSPLRHANAEPQQDAQKQIRRSSRTKHAPQILDLDPSKAKYGLIRA